MKRIVYTFALLTLLAASAHAQDNHYSLVRQAWTDLRTAGYNLSDGGDTTPCSNFLLVRLVATRLRSEGAGALQKSGGTVCTFEGESYAKDIVAYPDGQIYDVIGTGPETGSYDPHWDAKDPVDPVRWRQVKAFDVVAPTPSPDPQPSPQPQPAPTIDIAAVIAEIKASTNLEQLAYTDLVKRLEALDRANFTQIKEVYDLVKAHDENPSWLKKVVTNHYVQAALVAVAARLGLPKLGL